VPVGYNQAPVHRRFPTYLSQFRPAHASRIFWFTEVWGSQGRRLLLRFASDQPFGQSLKATRSRSWAGDRDHPATPRRCRMMSSARRLSRRIIRSILPFHRAAWCMNFATQTRLGLGRCGRPGPCLVLHGRIPPAIDVEGRGWPRVQVEAHPTGLQRQQKQPGAAGIRPGSDRPSPGAPPWLVLP